MEYSVITPAKNEGHHIEMTLSSMANQTIKPQEWIILDDYSSDDTKEKILPYIDRYEWIIYKLANPKTHSDYSSRVVEIFNFGFSLLIEKPEIIVKLDADVSFPPEFFENILREFETNPKLGIASGHLTLNGLPEEHKYGSLSTRGATKCYRLECLREIGGVVPAISWDTIDNAGARAKGWQTRTLPYYFEHLKEEGSRAGSYLKNHFRTGISNGSIPYYFPYFILKIMLHSKDRPIIIGSIVQLAGYIKSRFVIRYRPFPAFASRQVRKEQRDFIRSLLK